MANRESDVEQITDASPSALRERIERYRLALIAVTLGIILQIGVMVSAAVTPLLTIFLVFLVERYVEGLPALQLTTNSPQTFQLTFGGPGLKTTTFVYAAAVAVIGRRLYRLNTRGFPWVEVKREQETDTMDQEKDDDG